MSVRPSKNSNNMQPKKLGENQFGTEDEMIVKKRYYMSL